MGGSTPKAEEEGRVAAGADVGRAVHGEDVAAGGQHEVEHGEDALLDLAGVGGAPDEDGLLGEVDDGVVGLARTVARGVGEAAGEGEDGPLVGDKPASRAAVGPQEHVVREEILPGVLGVDADVDAVFLARAGVGVADVDGVAGFGVSLHLSSERVVVRGGDGLVDGVPVDGVARDLVLDEEAIPGAAAGELPGVDDEGARVGEVTLAGSDGGLDEGRV